MKNIYILIFFITYNVKFSAMETHPVGPSSQPCTQQVPVSQKNHRLRIKIYRELEQAVHALNTNDDWRDLYLKEINPLIAQLQELQKK